jgi:hypothetical protein
VQLVGAVCRQQQHVRQPGRTDQEADQVAGRPVGPVQVLDDQHQGLLCGQPAEQGGDHLEQHASAGLAGGLRRRTEFGQQAGEILLTPVEDGRAVGLHEPAQRGRERGEGQPFLTQLEALTGEDASALGGGQPAELLHQAGLADAGLAADQNGRRLGVAGALEGVAQGGEIGLPADQDVTAGVCRHVIEHVTPRA